ncbi:phage tail protein [Vibrio parahaemolyticus]|uniref:phage tail-collar fiber domain-containing protein n=1 Tax=Vibrio parahaemolyticus TaxID=670 RepID=UPI0024AEBD0D|nr:phage tail protein [Vibrio parahaemolyticus]MDI7847988.1 phage tail protein [Vibrio parahaemolyticus]
MANSTDKSILTAAGKALLAQLNAEEKALVIDKMIFANVPNRPEYPQPDDVVPTDHIVHQEQVEQRGRLSADSVIYSSTLTSDVGPFDFNWTGAYCSEYGVLVTIDHHALTPKTADEPGVAGNTLVRSVVLEYKDIAEITNITVDASSWQYNATERMKKMDSDVAQSIIDQNGKDWFIEDGFLVTPSGSAYSIKAGAGYVSGNRVAMEFDRSVQVPNKPSFIYIDAHREGTPTGEQVTLFNFVVTAEEKDDYIDSSTGKDVKHFVCKIAQVLADGSVSDLRPEGESANKNWVRKENLYNTQAITGTKPLVGYLDDLIGENTKGFDSLYIIGTERNLDRLLVMNTTIKTGVLVEIDLERLHVKIMDESEQIIQVPVYDWYSEEFVIFARDHGIHPQNSGLDNFRALSILTNSLQLTGGTILFDRSASYTFQVDQTLELSPFVVLDFNNSVIKFEESKGKAFSKIVARGSHSFRYGFGIRNARLGSNRKYGDWSREYDHLMIIDGGWVMSIVFENIFAEPNLSIKSALKFDLSDKDNVGEIGVPDTSEFSNLNFLKAYGTSAIISVDAGNNDNARIGQISVKNALFSGGPDYDNDKVCTGFRAAILLDGKVGWGAGTFDNIYGNPHVILSNDERSKFNSTKFTALYQEIDNYIETEAIKNGSALIRSVTLENCIVEKPKVYIDTIILPSKPGVRSIIDAIMINTDVVKPMVIDPRGDWANLDDLMIYRVGSYGGKLEQISFSESIDYCLDWQNKVSVPSTVQIKNIIPEYKEKVRRTRITEQGIYELCNIDNKLIEMSDQFEFNFNIVKGVGSVTFKMSGFKYGDHPFATIELSECDIRCQLRVNILGNDSKRNLDAAFCSISKTMFKESNSAFEYSEDATSIYEAGSDLKLIAVVEGGVDLTINSLVASQDKSIFIEYK